MDTRHEAEVCLTGMNATPGNKSITGIVSVRGGLIQLLLYSSSSARLQKPPRPGPGQEHLEKILTSTTVHGCKVRIVSWG